MTIKIEEFDSDPYTGIKIIEDGIEKQRMWISPCFPDLSEWIGRQRFYPETVVEMSNLIKEYEEIQDKLMAEVIANLKQG